MDLSTIQSLRESALLEAKAAKGGLPKSIWESVSAFANTSGGVILLGVSETSDGQLEITGLENPDKLLDDFWHSANNPDKLSSCIISGDGAYVQRADTKQIIVIEVPRAERHLRPVFINGNPLTGTYRRKHTGDYRCSQSEVQAMYRDGGDAPADAAIVEDASMSDLNAESIAAYRETYDSTRQGHAWSSLAVPDFLCRIGAAARDKAGDIRPTRAGLLMFGEEWTISRTFYAYFIEYRRRGDEAARWSDRFTSQDGRWSGNLYDCFYRAYGKLAQALPLPFATDGLYRATTTLLHEAVREALVNCFVNADYEGAGGIRIELSPEGIELSNPGGFRVAIDEVYTGGLSDPRNKGVMKIFSQIGLAERAGSGIPNMIANWEASGLEKPRLSEDVDPERSLVFLPFAKRASGQNTAVGSRASADVAPAAGTQDAGVSNEDVAMELAGSNGRVTTKALAERLGITNVTARRILKGLTDNGALVWVGQSRNDPTQYYALP